MRRADPSLSMKPGSIWTVSPTRASISCVSSSPGSASSTRVLAIATTANTVNMFALSWRRRESVACSCLLTALGRAEPLDWWGEYAFLDPGDGWPATGQLRCRTSSRVTFVQLAARLSGSAHSAGEREAMSDAARESFYRVVRSPARCRFV